MADAPPGRQLADEKAQRHLQVAAFCTVAGIVGTFIGLYGVGLLSALGVVLVAAGSGVALVVMASPATPAGRRRTSSLLVLVSTVWVGLLAIGALGSASA